MPVSVLEALGAVVGGLVEALVELSAEVIDERRLDFRPRWAWPTKASAATAASHLKRMILLPVVIARPGRQPGRSSAEDWHGVRRNASSFCGAMKRPRPAGYLDGDKPSFRRRPHGRRPPPPSQLPFPVLIGDIGGTNARFALIPDRDAPVEVFARSRPPISPTSRRRSRPRVLAAYGAPAALGRSSTSPGRSPATPSTSPTPTGLSARAT